MSMPASSWSRIARSTASSSISSRSAGPNSPRSAAVDPGHEPRRSRVRADDAGEERLLAHRSPSANAYARAGLSTKRRVPDGGVDAALLELVAEAAQQVGQTRRPAVRACSSPAARRPSRASPGRPARPRPPTRGARWCRSRGRPSGTPGRRRRTRRSPAARGGSRGPRPCRRGSARSARPGRRPRSGGGSAPARPVPASQWVWIGHAGPPVGRGRRAEDRHVAIGRAVLAAGDLDDPGPDRRPVDDRARVVARVDARPRRPPRTGPPARPRSRAGSSGTGRRTSRGGGPWQPRGGRRSAATAPRASSGSRPQSAGIASTAVRRPASAASRSSAVMRSTSARRKSGEISTGFPPTMTRCSCA